MASEDRKLEAKVDTNFSEEYALHPEQELRFEAEKGHIVKLEVIGSEGNAELFGTELIRNKPYFFGSGKGFGVFTWSSCKIKLTGKTESAYISKDTPMIPYLNVSFAIENLRKEAEAAEERGPRVLICGSLDVGKTTLSRILLNYGVRLGRRPVYIDLDVGQQSIGIPGTIGALMVERPADPIEGFDMKAPITYHFGHTTPTGNYKLYIKLIERIQDIFNTKGFYNNKALYSGCIINTGGWVKHKGYEALLKTAELFEANVVLVVDTERLYQDLKRDLPDFVHVLKLQKSPGVLQRSKEQRRESREQLIREYYDGPKGNYYPYSFEISFDSVEIYKIGAPSLPDSALPIGMVQEDTQTKIVQIQPSKDLMNHILSVSRATSIEEDLIQTNVAGFIVVKSVDEDRGTMTIKSPAPHPLPGRFLLLSTLRYMDQS